MLHYAMSLRDTELDDYRMIPAFRRSKLKSIEMTFGKTDGESASRRSPLRLEWLREGCLHIPGVHLPAMEPSAFDEPFRKNEVARLIRVIEESAYTGAKQYTLHSGGQITGEEERRQCIRQLRKSLEEMLPTARKYGISLNLELLPRQAPHNTVDSLLDTVEGFDPAHVGICFDVNHASGNVSNLESMIDRAAPWIRSFHLSDFDGLDENHWPVNTGIIDWCAVMRAIRKIPHDLLLVLETVNTTTPPTWNPHRKIDPFFRIQHIERQICFLENCELITRLQNELVIRN